LATWLIRKDAKVQQYWRRLSNRSASEQAAFAEAERILSEKPYPFNNPSGTIKHLKGDLHCHHEYRKLPNAQRIFYKIWTRQEIIDARKRRDTDIPIEPVWENEEQLGIVIFFFAGPHPKER
jgi:hypothetical protein